MPAKALMGFSMGVTSPLRDVLVRANAPAGATGRVQGFVYAGLHVGAPIGTAALGWYLDRGAPHMVFVGVAICLLFTITSVVSLPQRRGLAPR